MNKLDIVIIFHFKIQKRIQLFSEFVLKDRMLKTEEKRIGMDERWWKISKKRI